MHLVGYLYITYLINERKMERVKINFTLEQATKAQMGIRGIALLFL